MKMYGISIRTYIGAKDYDISRAFYKELGFSEHKITSDLSYYKISEEYGFYLQAYYIEDWINNTMILLEVNDVEECWRVLTSKRLEDKYNTIRITDLKKAEWGGDFFVQDPSGVLWRFAKFNNRNEPDYK
jgi:catechol 2,3-dioxygenase-like lactoylglutathione lyase family enzyme